MILNKDNYYSNEANLYYWSNSQLKDFQKCQEMTVAKLNGWEDEEKAAFVEGQYFHALLEGEDAAESYLNQYREMETKNEHRKLALTQKGELTAGMKRAKDAYERIIQDEYVLASTQGQKEVIFTAELFGVPWKAMIDVYNPETKTLTDYKLLRDFKDIWCELEFTKKNVFTARGYDVQMSLYAEIERVANGRDEGDYYMPYITAATKETPTNFEIVSFADTDEELTEFVQERILPIGAQIEMLNEVKTGFRRAIRCENCKYCIETKKLSGAKHYLNFGRE